MERFREFQGKDLDECIDEACSFFGTPREKLEIEIVQNSKSGIFGIVLARKAKIRARRAEAVNKAQDPIKEIVEEEINHTQNNSLAYKSNLTSDYFANNRKRESYGGSYRNTHRFDNRGNRRYPFKSRWQRDREDNRSFQRERKDYLSHAENGAMPGDKSFDEQDRINSSEGMPEFSGRRMEHDRYKYSGKNFRSVENSSDESFIDDEYIDDRIMNVENLDTEKLISYTREVISKIMSPIAGQPIEADVEIGRTGIAVKVKWEGDAGLLIGREGQTLNAIQYLASRMISHIMDVPLRIHLDIGEYRSRQDSKLQEIAFALCERVKITGHSFATRPMSSYERRVIHLSLQNETEIETRSAGDGPLKRVLIFPRNDNR